MNIIQTALCTLMLFIFQIANSQTNCSGQIALDDPGFSLEKIQVRLSIVVIDDDDNSQNWPHNTTADEANSRTWLNPTCRLGMLTRSKPIE